MNVLSAPSAIATATAATADKSSASGLASDFETFLKMLTAQARYQDPLEPIDLTEYASQLAQFSMVEQQVKTNDMLSALSGQFGSGGMESLAGWIGLEVRAPMSVDFTGAPVTILPRPAAAADQASLVVSNAAGLELQRLNIPISSDPIQWAGLDETGQPFTSGTYDLEVESYAGGELISSIPVEVYGRIVEAQIQNGTPVLVLKDGQVISAESSLGGPQLDRCRLFLPVVLNAVRDQPEDVWHIAEASKSGAPGPLGISALALARE